VLISELAEYAACQFRLEKLQKDGATLRQHLQMAYTASGIMPDELANEIEMPELTAYLWRYFFELNSERSSNGMGPNRLTSTGIKDWCYLTRTSLDPWEVRAIKLLDSLWIDSVGGKNISKISRNSYG